MTSNDESNTDSATSEAKPSVQEIQADIEATRAELSETVDALTAKLDVKSRTRKRVAATKDQAAVKVHDVQVRAGQLAGNAKQSATDAQGKPKPEVLAGAGVVAAVVVAGIVLLVWQRRR